MFFLYINGGIVIHKISRIILVTLLLLAVTGTMYSLLNTHKFSFEFSVDDNDSTIEVEKVQLEGRVTKLPFYAYHIKGSLVVGEYENRLTKFEKDNTLDNPHYIIYFIDPRKERSTGLAFLSGDIFSDNVETLEIVIMITDEHTGSVHTSQLTCSIIK